VDYGEFGPASIAIEGDVTRGAQYVPRAKHMLANLLARMRVGGLQQGSDHWVLDENDGSYAYAIVAGAVRKCVIVVGEVNGESQGVASFVAQVPDFYSGIVVGGTIIGKDDPQNKQQRKLHAFWPTPHCAQLFKLPTSTFDTVKLAVDPYNVFFSDLGNTNSESPLVFSQYLKLKPTMYSGLMRQVVQFLMGFGKQAKKSIYDKAQPKIKAKKPLPAPANNPDANLTTYQRDVKKNGVQIRFDWRWYRTHGITKATDGTLWIVEVSNSRGVLAFRLPINSLTLDPKFRKKLENLGDDAGLYALDHLGAWPTGESIPTTSVDSWKRAGLVIELATQNDMQPFYHNGAFSSQMGWAFSPDGREAHNTCNGWDGDMQNAQHYALDISIGNFRKVDPPKGAQALKARFQSLQGQKEFQDRYPAIMAKIDRLSDRDCDSYIERTDPADELFNDLDSVQLDACAAGSAHLSLVSKSPLYYPGKYQIMIKFPWPELGYLMSHDMRSSGPVADTRCDATVHVFWAGGELKYVRYFRDPRPGPTNVHTDDFEDCMWVGTWHSHDETGPRPIGPQMYTNDFDARQETASETVDTTITSKDLGYWEVGIQDDLVYPPHAWLFRSKRFLRTTSIKRVQGAGQGAAVTVPFYDRCAYYFTSVVGSSSTQVFGGTDYPILYDPWFCNTWRNFGGWTSGHDEHPDKCCICQARTVTSPAPVYAYGGYSGGAGDCADFADEGPWCFVCDNADAMVYALPAPPPPIMPNYVQGADFHRITHLVNDSEFSPILVEDAHFDGLHYERYWFIPSPDPDTLLTQYIDTTCNAFGEGNAVRYMFQPNEGPVKTLGGPFPPSFNGEGITFVGVVP